MVNATTPFGTTALPAPLAPGQTTGGAVQSPLSGFAVQATPADQQRLATTLARIGSTSIGGSLLASVRNQGIAIQVVDDASFTRETNGRAPDALAVFASSAGTTPRLIVRSSSLAGSDPSMADHVIAHELTHALQHVVGENETTYLARASGRGVLLGYEQVRTGATLMKESGAELVASAIDAQLSDATTFAAAAARNLPAVAQQSWQRVAGLGVYNASGGQMPPVISPVSDLLVRRSVGLA